MDSNRKLTFVFIMILFMMYVNTVLMPYFSPPAPQGSTPTPVQQVASEAPSGTAVSTAVTQETIVPSEMVDQTADGFVTVETDSVVAKLSLRGAALHSLKLKDYFDEVDGSEILELIQPSEFLGLPLKVAYGGRDDKSVLFAANSASSVRVTDKKEVVFSAVDSTGVTVTKSFLFSKSGFIIGLQVKAINPDGSVVPTAVSWTEFQQPKPSSMFDPYDLHEFVYLVPGDSPDREGLASFGEFDQHKEPLPTVTWVTMSSKYFQGALLSPDGPRRGELVKNGDNYSATLGGSSFEIYAGPIDSDILASLGRDFEKSVNFGFARFISLPLLHLLKFFYSLVGNYGIAIVLLTIVVKIVLLPLSAASFKQMKAMQVVAPEMKKVRETIKDPQKRSEAMMKIYQKHKVNPLGGCLPMLPQLPIFYGLFSALRQGIELRHAPFAFWVQDLSAAERMPITDGFGVPLMAILLGVTMFFQQKLTPRSEDPQQADVQKKLMYILPLMFGFFSMQFPAGLNLYWITGNLITITQVGSLRDGSVKRALNLTFAASAAILGLTYLLVWLG